MGVKMKIVRIANKVLDFINQLLEYLIGTLMLVLVAITFTEVVRRYVFNDPTHWASEFCRFLLIWMTFTGASIVTRLVAHLTMGFTIHRFVGKVASRTVKVLVAGTVAFVMIVITYYSAKVTILAGYRQAPMTGMPMYIPWSALPINALVMSIYMIAETIVHLLGDKEEVAQ
jgi:C4-dicarboxylate transporter DctQ subunit